MVCHCYYSVYMGIVKADVLVISGGLAALRHVPPVNPVLSSCWSVKEALTEAETHQEHRVDLQWQSEFLILW